MPVVKTTNLFSNNEQITSAKLNNIMVNSSFDSGAVLSGQGLQVTAGGQMQIGDGANGVTTSKLADLSVTPAKISTGGPSWTTSSISLPNPTTITGNSTVTGNATVTGDATVTGNATVTGETTSTGALTVGTAKMNVPSGSAPIYGTRAWVNFNGQANTDISGTYARTSSTTVTITATAHGLIAGNSVYLDFPVGTGTLPFDGLYLVNSVTDANTFTVISSTTTTSTGTATLKRKTIRGSGNVSNVSAAYSGANPVSPPTANQTIDNGYYVLNFATAMPDANFAISGSCNESGALAAGSGNDIINGFGYNEKCAFITTISIAGSAIDCLHNSVQVIR
jgi:hypothetical protein